MADFNFNDIIEYIDGTRDLNFEAARKWAREHNALFEENIESRKTRTITEEYEAEEPFEIPYTVPAQTHEEIVEDENGNQSTITVVDVPEHEEIRVEYRTVTKTREVEQLLRYFEIKQKPVIEPTEEEIKAARIAQLKASLASTDYVVIKIAEGVATPEDYTDVISQRQAWRAEINELEG